MAAQDTLDNKNLTASFYKRLVAFSIDQIVVLMGLVALDFVLGQPTILDQYALIQSAMSPEALQDPDFADKMAQMNEAAQSPLYDAISFLVAWTYFAVQEFYLGATLGKRLCKMKVTKSDGRTAITSAQAFGRNMLKALAVEPTLWGAAAALTFLTVLVTPRKQALHDMVFQTLVVNHKEKAV